MTQLSIPGFDFARKALLAAVRIGDARILALALDALSSERARPAEPATRADDGAHSNPGSFRSDLIDAALSAAAFLHSGECLALLLGAGVDPNAADDRGHSLCMIAASRDSQEQLRMLLESGADSEARGTNGMTALMAAAFCGWPASIRTLAAAGARLDEADDDGSTAALHAAGHGDPDCLRDTLAALIEAGADPWARDSQGAGIADIAARRGNGDVAAQVLARREAELLRGSVVRPSGAEEPAQAARL